MIKTKPFRKTAQIAPWFNRPENRHLELISAIREGVDEIQALYREPDTQEDPAPERRAVLRAKIDAHLGYPRETRTKLGYPKSILDFPVVPVTRLVNSLRNLRAFKGLSPSELSDWVGGNLPGGCVLLARPVSKQEYGVDFALIEKPF